MHYATLKKKFKVSMTSAAEVATDVCGLSKNHQWKS